MIPVHPHTHCSQCSPAAACVCAPGTRPHLLSETATLSLVIYGVLESSHDSRLFAQSTREFTRTPRRLMTKLEANTDVEIDISFGMATGLLRLTAAGLAKSQQAASVVPALWASLQ